MTLKFAQNKTNATPIHVVESDGLSNFVEGLSGSARNWVASQEFRAGLGHFVIVPNADGGIDSVIAGYGNETVRKRGRFHLATVAAVLPEGKYKLETFPASFDLETELLGWLLSGYSFDRYKTRPAHKASIVAPANCDAAKLEAIAAGEALTRDLINTPTSDMGPPQLQEAFETLAAQHGAETVVRVGQDLLDQNFPMIHTVGRASAQEPRLLEMRWGSKGPKLTLVGKGVCFDTGGLNIKPGASMGLMKKDMGGSAAVLGLAHMIMSLGLPIQLRVLVPAVENAIDGSAFRPQDVLTSRKGLTVEINNTDAEGRLVLADALALADEEETDLIVSMATLTGAARVAVGPDLAPYYVDAQSDASALEEAATTVADPVWRMPFHDPYEAMIEPSIADLDNAPKGGFAGSITAALFLRRFVTENARYMHFDIYGWQPKSAPARPVGGVGQGTRALLEALPKLLDL
ncbi:MULTISPECIES: leucyl aminopeptidase family protein [Halocynthiibacter]|uniref:Leucyl aminopeptidase family protein n=1 Tax=Halocynthiibacter halioticoli TaxID=2986804 RepID=A0AAE3J143_9RHOB|nr:MULTISPECIES: leucyl aminopeptidase family protein [Halocynthiibacter]MCV6825858.1 leucyl aminopeptidase family protein [Halocynthiibacter halioticoli]MCW4058859.1 leucyl aminopeptidase family protein [Halocynthiibacter sp. SDUM655004]